MPIQLSKENLDEVAKHLHKAATCLEFPFLELDHVVATKELLIDVVCVLDKIIKLEESQ